MFRSLSPQYLYHLGLHNVQYRLKDFRLWFNLSDLHLIHLCIANHQLANLLVESNLRFKFANNLKFSTLLCKQVLELVYSF